MARLPSVYPGPHRIHVILTRRILTLQVRECVKLVWHCVQLDVSCAYRPFLPSIEDDLNRYSEGVFASAGVATLVGLVVAYPFDTVRRRIMLLGDSIEKYRSDCAWRTSAARRARLTYRFPRHL